MSPVAEAGARAALERLARARAVAVSYVGVDGTRRAASDDTLVGVLAALGEDLRSPADAPALVRARRRDRDGATVPGAVVVAWDGVLPARPGPAGSAGEGSPASRRSLQVRLEGASSPERLPARPGPDGTLVVDDVLPSGVHELLDADGRRLAWALSAPVNAPPIAQPGGWALFAPTYALRDRRHGPAGDLTALTALGALGARHGASTVATLPILAEWSCADGAAPGQQPYAPLSRMWWNEGYLDLDRLPELASTGGAALAARARQAHGAPPRHARDGRRLADVAAAAAAARPALDHAAAVLARDRGPRRQAFEAFRAARPDLERYARFRAAGEAAGPDLARWPAAWRRGELDDAALSPDAVARHRYAQFATAAQLAEVAAELSGRRCGLLLDLPVGCAAGGFDPWAFPDAFATGASVGAPPDDFFVGGQDWGFPPPHPGTDRSAGYPILRQVLAHNAAAASVLRIDHVLGWARLWWVPAGLPPTEGAYVRYRTEELLALACLEASRAGCALVGEDLGTVPPGLRPALRRHGVAGMRVAVFDLEAAPGRRLRPPAGTVAYVDTHDTATFAAFTTGDDIAQRARLGLGPKGRGAEEATAARAAALARVAGRLVAAGRLHPAGRQDPAALLAAVLDELGESAAELVVVALEDLLGEHEPQNMPGTTTEHDNFSRTLAATLEELAGDDRVGALLGRLDAARRRARSGVARPTLG